MRMLKHRVATAVCAAALSMIFSRTGAAQMAREEEIVVETQAVYHSRLPLPHPAVRSEAKPAVHTAGAVLGAGVLELRGSPEDSAPWRVGVSSGATGEAADAGGVLGRSSLGVERGMVYLGPGALGRATAGRVGPSGGPLLGPPDAVPPHDLEQARVVRESQRLGRPGHVPLVPLERRDHDPPLCLRLELLERLAAVRPARRPRRRISGGTCSGPITSPSVAMIIRSTTFLSSRTLFRGHS